MYTVLSKSARFASEKVRWLQLRRCFGVTCRMGNENLAAACLMCLSGVVGNPATAVNDQT